MNQTRKLRHYAPAPRLTTHLLLIAILLGWLAVPLRGLAAPGDLDLTFGSTGYCVTPIGSGEDTGEAVVIQSDGKIIVAGSAYTGTDSDFAATRYNTDGSLDTTFNGDGILTTDFATGPDHAYDAALQTDGKLILAGQAYSAVPYLAITRYDTAGDLDPDFGVDGRVMLSFGTTDAVGTAVSLQSDNKIVVAGYVQIGSDYDIAVARFLSNGEPDPAFSGDGQTTTSIGEGWERAYDLAIQSDGKIVVVGEDRSSEGSSAPSYAILRYNTDGSLDTSFGDGGIALTSAGDESIAYGAALQGDGKIVVVGQITQAGYDYFGIARYKSDGTPDIPGFGDTGYVMISPGYGGYASDVVIQPDNMIVAAGRGDFDGSGYYDFTLMRLNWIGGMDNEFGIDGIVHSSLVTGDDSALGVTVQADGKIVAAGVTNNGSNDDFGVARFYGQETPPVIQALLSRYSFSGGGGETSGPTLSLRGSIAQHSAIGETSGSSLALRAGFWHAAGDAVRITVTSQVTPESGGYLLSPDGQTAFQFPAGSVNSNVTVTFTQQTAPYGTLQSLSSSQLNAADATRNLVFAENAFNLEAVDDLGNPFTNFLQPYTLTLDYLDSDWQNAGITDESSLGLYYWDVGSGEWIGLLPCTDCWLDMNAKRLTIQFNHTGDFALLGEISYPLYLPLVIQ
jgi:uncharacterized delta-60 repeat protein